MLGIFTGFQRPASCLMGKISSVACFLPFTSLKELVGSERADLPGHQGLKSKTNLARAAFLDLCSTVSKYSPMGASAGGVTSRSRMPCRSTEDSR